MPDPKATSMKNPSGLRVVVTLTAITAIAAALLAVVDGLTREKIAQAQLQAKVDALQALLPPFDNTPQANPFQRVSAFFEVEGAWRVAKDGANPAACPKGAFCVYTARAGEEVVGYGVETWTKKGYGGLIKLLVVADARGAILDFRTLAAKETPGLGTKADEPGFRDQFAGKALGGFGFEVKKDGGDVEAITSATISSRAYSEAIAKGLEAIHQAKEGGR